MLSIDLPNDVRKAGPEDAALLGGITAEAFRNDLVSRWMFCGSEAMKPVFGSLAKNIYTARGLCHIAGDEAAAMWLPPNTSKEAPLAAYPTLAINLLRFGGVRALRRTIKADAIMQTHQPKEPHVYLFTVGVVERSRGAGLGRKLITPVLAACDESGLPAYLENSNPDNHGFYRSLGFERLEIFTPGFGAPPLEAMWRVPRRS